MDALFHLAADLEVGVQSEPALRGVALRIIRGVCYSETSTVPEDKREVTQILLPKAVARAVASAMMASAALVE